MNPKYVPRDYAEACIEAVLAEFRSGIKRTLIVLATGTGKTEIYLQVAERFMKDHPGRNVLILAHREELITQPLKRWRRNLEESPAIEMGELKVGCVEEELFGNFPTNANIVLSSVQTLNSGRRCGNCTADCETCQAKGRIETKCDECDGTGRIFNHDFGDDSECADCDGNGRFKTKCKECQGDGWICTFDDCELCFEHFNRRMQKFRPEDFGLLIVDEAHHATADTYTRVIRYFGQRNSDLCVLGPTATPDRHDEEAMSQVFQTVAYVYNLPQPILDGWLTPVDQQFITIDELNLSRVRTTAGDLNSGDLEREMLAEQVLHKVTTPLVEIACGLEPGTIDRLIKEGTLEALPNLCTKQEPTLIHAVDVAHAERMTEIINRYFPESALCIIGTTNKKLRREGLKKFEDCKYQFLLSCGVFLEGTDLPNVSIIGMARPTKSRALYSQMIGRGLRPMSGLVDGIATAEERCRLIAQSPKPKCIVVDFVGNSGRHKLISAADILGDNLDDSLVEVVIRKAAKEGVAFDVLRALDEAKKEAEAKKRDQARRDAIEAQKKEQEAKQRAANRRAGIVAGATYTSTQINPFDVMEVAAQREPGWHKGRKPSEAMKEILQKNKIPFTEQTTWWEAHLIIDEIFKRRREGLCTFSQAKWLKSHGYSDKTSFTECRRIMDAWSRNGWQRPESEKGDAWEPDN